MCPLDLSDQSGAFRIGIVWPKPHKTSATNVATEWHATAIQYNDECIFFKVSVEQTAGKQACRTVDQPIRKICMPSGFRILLDVFHGLEFLATVAPVREKMNRL